MKVKYVKQRLAVFMAAAMTLSTVFPAMAAVQGDKNGDRIAFGSGRTTVSYTHLEVMLNTKIKTEHLDLYYGQNHALKAVSYTHLPGQSCYPGYGMQGTSQRSA